MPRAAGASGNLGTPARVLHAIVFERSGPVAYRFFFIGALAFVFSTIGVPLKLKLRRS
jgi:hypothetical protein